MADRRWTLGLLGIAVLIACTVSSPSAGLASRAAASQTVDMKGFKFVPASVTINVGDTIVWQNGDQARHTATADDGSWGTGDVAGAGTASTTFDKPGTFAFYCKYHGGPGGSGMSGTVIVKEAASAQPTAAPTAAQPQATAMPVATAQPATAAPTPARMPATSGGENTLTEMLLIVLVLFILGGVLIQIGRRRAA